MSYSCTNPACGWRGEEAFWHRNMRKYLCPKCMNFTEDLDFLERAAIREESPMSRADAERLAIEDLEKWERGE